MTKIEFKKASEPLSKYAQRARKDLVIVVKKGKPFAAVVPIRNADDVNQSYVAKCPNYWASTPCEECFDVSRFSKRRNDDLR